MIVVSNTSPLTNLAAVGQFHLLKPLHGEIHIAGGVWDELNARGQAWPGSREVAEAPWIHRHEAQNRTLVTALRRDVDRGEAETIALALELRADLVLMDERDGRSVAQRFDLKVSGVAGVLLAAKKAGHLAEVRPVLDALRRQAGFFLAETLYQAVLTYAGETVGR